MNISFVDVYVVISIIFMYVWYFATNHKTA